MDSLSDLAGGCYMALLFARIVPVERLNSMPRPVHASFEQRLREFRPFRAFAPRNSFLPFYLSGFRDGDSLPIPFVAISATLTASMASSIVTRSLCEGSSIAAMRSPIMPRRFSA